MQDLQASNTERASSGSREVDEKAGEKNKSKEKTYVKQAPLRSSRNCKKIREGMQALTILNGERPC